MFTCVSSIERELVLISRLSLDPNLVNNLLKMQRTAFSQGTKHPIYERITRSAICLR